MSDEKTSLEQVGGVAAGLSGRIMCYNADAEARFANALMQIGKWVEHETGSMLGHIKAAITLDDGTGITLNLTDLSNGVEKHGNLDPQEVVNFTFMCAVLDVDEHELEHMMYHALDDTGIDYELNEHVECHCHDHDHHHDGECHCHDHDHEHHHDHDHHHDHHHEDGECHCHDHDHHHHHHDHHHEDGECHCHEHHHDDDEECHCHDHHHDHEHHHHHDGECHCHDKE